MLELAIDLGSCNLTVYKKGEGLILKEPEIAVAVKGKKTKLTAMGIEARKKVGFLDKGEKLYYPVREGSVVESDILTLMLKDTVSRVMPAYMFKPLMRVVAVISQGLSAQERKETENVLKKAGFNEVYLVESTVADAVYTDDDTCFVVDIGAGVCDIAAVENHAIVAGCSLNIAGDAFSAAIKDFVCNQKKMIIGDLTAEKIKHSLVSMVHSGADMTISGKDLLDGSLKSVELTSVEASEALRPLVLDLAEAIKSVFCSIPENLAYALCEKGILLCGGSAALSGLDTFLYREIGIAVHQAEDYPHAAALGAGKLSQDAYLLEKITTIHEK